MEVSENQCLHLYRYLHVSQLAVIIIIIITRLGANTTKYNYQRDNLLMGMYKQCMANTVCADHVERCTGNDTYAYVHSQGSLTGIRKPQY